MSHSVNLFDSIYEQLKLIFTIFYGDQIYSKKNYRITMSS